MDSFELNKMAGAFLGVVFIVMSVAILSDSIFETETPEEFGYAIEAEEAAHGEEAGAEAVEEVSIATLMADADPAAGASSFKKCAACHAIEEGGPNKVGPNLWDVVNRPVASYEGFSYSSALREFSEGGSVVWDYEHLSGFLKAPKDYVPGTAMGFAGLKKDEERANVIAYLREQAPDPAPLPEPEAAEEPAEAPEGGEEAADGADGAEAPADAEAAPSEEAASGQDDAPASEAPSADAPAAEQPASEQPAAQ